MNRTGTIPAILTATSTSVHAVLVTLCLVLLLPLTPHSPVLAAPPSSRSDKGSQPPVSSSRPDQPSVETLSSQLAIATSVLEKLRSEFQAELESSPEYRATKARLDQAVSDLDKASDSDRAARAMDKLVAQNELNGIVKKLSDGNVAIAQAAKKVNDLKEGIAAVSRAKPSAAPPKEHAGPERSFDKDAFEKGLDLVTGEATKHFLEVCGRPVDAGNMVQALPWLVGSVAKYWTRDAEGNINRKVDSRAFTAAVLSVTQQRLKVAKELAGESANEAGFVALIVPAADFVTSPGRFNDAHFSAALNNLDGAKTQRGAKLMGTVKAVAVVHMLRASAAIVKDGKFDASGFNGRFDALRDQDFSGTETERIDTFMRLMRLDGPTTQPETEKPTTRATGEVTTG